MSDLTTSVIVVSRDRPAALARCVLALSQLYHQQFEIIVVADPAGLAAVARWAGQIKTVPLDEANIALARNLGLDHAGGEIVAFIDDDAVPEPTWLCYLLEAFEAEAISGAGGYVRGRNGISYQWMARSVASDGSEAPLDLPMQGVLVPALSEGQAIKTQGTNMAFRTRVLRGLGGFDEAYHFYLEDADLNLRMTAAGHRTAVVPMAQVHHSFAASPRRRADRVPRDLSVIGASEAVFLRRHGDIEAAPVRSRTLRQRHRKSLLRHMVAGRLTPGDIGRLLQTLKRGWADGIARDLPELSSCRDSDANFLRFHPLDTIFASRNWGWRALRNRNVQLSAERASDGVRLTLYLLSLWPLRHQVRYDERGFWVQTGGIIGRAERTKTGFLGGTFRKRYEIEAKRVAEFREPRS